jgi:uncharacterized protein with PQ loop repeat
MREMLINAAGWIPALTLPAATLAQLWKIARAGRAENVALSTWLLFGIANLGMYVFTEKFTTPQSILGQLVTAVLNFAIVGWILVLRRREREGTFHD